YSPFAGTFDKAKNGAFKGVRSALDQSLKNAVPEYADYMKGVAKDADLLGRVQDFGDKQAASSILGRIDAPTQAERRQALEEWGKKYGVDFVAGSKPENLAEYERLQKAQATLEALRPDRVSQKIEQTVAGSRQKAALDAASASYETAKDKLAP